MNQTGLDLRKTTTFNIGGMPALWQAGVQFNDERIAALQFKTDADHRPLAPSASMPDVTGVDRNVDTTTQALYTQLQVQLVPSLKLTAGLRYDSLRIRSGMSKSGGSPADSCARRLLSMPEIGRAHV